MKGDRRRRFGAHRDGSGVTFGLWATTGKSVELSLDGRRHRLDDLGEGWREFHAASLPAGARYSYIIDAETEIPDPASAFQPDGIFSPSQYVDHDAYVWNDHGWVGRPWSEAVIWEAHVGTATPKGTYKALIDRLPHLKEVGITAIELMPIAEFPGSRNWGYDGVLPFAPTHNYGTPADLKDFVSAAHSHGIMVILDVVFNHFGPSGNFLHSYADRFFTERHHTPWGAGINFDSEGNEFVRQFFVQCAVGWIRDYHFDGLRFDAVHAMLDDSEEHILASLAGEIRKQVEGRQIHLILENEHNQSSWLERADHLKPTAFTAQWNDDFHHCWHVLMTGEYEGYYANFTTRPQALLSTALREGFVYQGQETSTGRTRGEPSSHLTPAAFVSFLQNHDQIGNRAFGERLVALADPDKLAVARAVLLLCPQIPMLFMGDEWGSKTPFLFFVDFADDQPLSDAVRNGRRREFAAFKAFASSDATASIPDPTAKSTFEQSALDWSDLQREGHLQILNHTQSCLDIRATHIVPFLETKWLGADEITTDPLHIRWRFGGGSLRLRLNLSDISLRQQIETSEQIIYQSDGCHTQDDGVVLDPWSCIFTTEVA